MVRTLCWLTRGFVKRAIFLLTGQNDRLRRRIVSVSPPLNQCDPGGNFPEVFAKLALIKIVCLDCQAEHREPYRGRVGGGELSLMIECRNSDLFGDDGQLWLPRTSYLYGGTASELPGAELLGALAWRR